MDKAILLQVSNGTSSVSLAPFNITVLAAGSSSGNVTLSWQAPTDNTNGSALLNLAGYVIHYGSVSKTYTSRSRSTIQDSRATWLRICARNLLLLDDGDDDERRAEQPLRGGEHDDHLKRGPPPSHVAALKRGRRPRHRLICRAASKIACKT